MQEPIQAPEQTPADQPPQVRTPAPIQSAADGQPGPVTPNVRRVIEMKGVTKRFGDSVAVQDLTFTVHEGEIFGFIGPSGSGKTTTIRLMNGTYQPTEGTATIFGQPARHMSARVRESIGYLPQLFILYPNLSVKENIDFSASLYGMSWFGRRKRRREVLEFVELWEHRSQAGA